MPLYHRTPEKCSLTISGLTPSHQPGPPLLSETAISNISRRQMSSMTATTSSGNEGHVGDSDGRSSPVSMWSNILRRLHAGEARTVAVGLVLAVIVYHSVMRVTSSGDSCQRLLKDGYFSDSRTWQPDGCSMHNYTQQEAKRCLHHRQLPGQQTELIFVGDSRLKFMFLELKKLLGQIPPKRENPKEFTTPQINLRVRFFWQAFMDDDFEELIRDLLNHNSSVSTPQLIIADSALHTIKLSENFKADLSQYRQNLTRVGSMLDKLAEEGSQVLWLVQAPLVHCHLKVHQGRMNNHKVLDYNAASRQALAGTRVHLWESYRQIGEGLQYEYTDGVHVGPNANRISVQVVINMLCNEHMNFTDGTCCTTSESTTWHQWITILTLAAFLLASPVLVGWIQTRSHTSVSNQLTTTKTSTSSPSAELATSLGKLCPIMGYFFLCDRTSLFMKTRRYFIPINFWTPLIFLTILGICSVKNSRRTKFLHHDQTDEWKGWMQLAILVYHMTYASQELPVYMHVRVLVSSYLFLTGYGHFMQFWNTGVVDFTRFFTVLFRMNMLTVLLCLVMNRPYQFYYFVPLVTFWYIMLYIMLVAPPRVNAESSQTDRYQYLYLVFKFVVFFTAITLLFTSETLFSRIFLTWPWRALFTNDSDDVQQWWFRSRLDRFSTAYGMLFAFMTVLAQRHLNSHRAWTSRMSTISAVLLAGAGMGSYTVFALRCHSKSECNSIHPYLTVLPVVGYIVLRNAVARLRTHHSSFFAWFGRISLELFIGQYHIWMADDAQCILVLVPHYHFLNLIITSFLFVCVSVEINKITNHLASMVVSFQNCFRFEAWVDHHVHPLP